jgi:hypothetical protein
MIQRTAGLVVLLMVLSECSIRIGHGHEQYRAGTGA